MATTTLASNVKQFPQSNPEIKQSEVIELVQARNAAVQLGKMIEALEANLKSRLEAGAAVELGAHICELRENLRRNVAWKDVSVRLAERLGLDGAAYCANVLAHTKPSRSVSVVVS